MIVENWKAELEKHLPKINEYLASVLKETAEIEIESVQSAEKGEIVIGLEKNDVFVFTKDETHQNSIILIMGKEWLGLLSSIMMGVEETKLNEITSDLLKKFTTEFSVMLKKQLRRSGLNLAPGEMEVLTQKQVEKHFVQEEYFHIKFHASGLSDKKVKMELLIGNPNNNSEISDLESKSPETDREAETITEKMEMPGDDKFSRLNPNELGSDSSSNPFNDQKMVTGRKVEFDNFEQPGIDELVGDTRNMALLKDVEMEVSVQLGQIEMPLGKVLQLLKGSIIELDKLAGEPVDILVNGSYIAQGEVVVIDEHFGVRISNLITTRERITRLR